MLFQVVMTYVVMDCLLILLTPTSTSTTTITTISMAQVCCPVIDLSS